MTTLRPDGLLETDSPVVAACAIRKFVSSGSGVHGRFCGYHWLGPDKFNIDGSFYTKILIPAATVAEIDRNSLEWSVLCDATSKHGDDAYPLLDWLKKHAGSSADRNKEE